MPVAVTQRVAGSVIANNIQVAIASAQHCFFAGKRCRVDAGVPRGPCRTDVDRGPVQGLFERLGDYLKPGAQGLFDVVCQLVSRIYGDRLGMLRQDNHSCGCAVLDQHDAGRRRQGRANGD